MSLPIRVRALLQRALTFLAHNEPRFLERPSHNIGDLLDNGRHPPKQKECDLNIAPMCAYPPNFF